MERLARAGPGWGRCAGSMASPIALSCLPRLFPAEQGSSGQGSPPERTGLGKGWGGFRGGGPQPLSVETLPTFPLTPFLSLNPPIPASEPAETEAASRHRGSGCAGRRAGLLGTATGGLCAPPRPGAAGVSHGGAPPKQVRTLEQFLEAVLRLVPGRLGVSVGIGLEARAECWRAQVWPMGKQPLSLPGGPTLPSQGFFASCWVPPRWERSMVRWVGLQLSSSATR